MTVTFTFEAPPGSALGSISGCARWRDDRVRQGEQVRDHRDPQAWLEYYDSCDCEMCTMVADELRFAHLLVFIEDSTP